MTARADLLLRRGELPSGLEVPHLSSACNCIPVLAAEILRRRREGRDAARPFRSHRVALSHVESPDSARSVSLVPVGARIVVDRALVTMSYREAPAVLPG